MERTAQAPRQLPPGFRFHPTDEELVVQYLRRKALSRPLPAAVIPVVHDGARLDPWDLPGASEGEGYFFSLRRAAATGRAGGRRRRAGSGYWMATGKEKPVFLQCGGKRQLLVGVKTALAFHRSEPSSSSSSRTCWVMHEYRLAVPGGAAEQRKNASHKPESSPSFGQLETLTATDETHSNISDIADDCVAEPGEEWVVCRVFLKNRPRRRQSRNVDGGRTPGNHASTAHRAAALQRREDAAGRQQPSLLMSPQPSSSSCVTGVTDITDQDEVSSSSSVRDAPAASQREA